MFLRRHNTSLLVRAPAKLNLFLEVLGKRSDGYHDLESLMLKIDLSDDLAFTPAEELSLTADLSGLPRGSQPAEAAFLSGDNLILKAARLLQLSTGCERGARIHVAKRIPLESGLAGGSTDAAATLVALNHLWNLGLSRTELQKLSAELGSDLPFFFSPSPAAICFGRGERVEPLPPGPELAFVIARPPSGLSTPLVFKNLKLTSEKVLLSPMRTAWIEGRWSQVGSHLFNRLQDVAESLNADVAGLRRCFERLPFAAHRMSGSGTSYFGICRTRREASRLANQLRSRNFGSVFVAAHRTVENGCLGI